MPPPRCLELVLDEEDTLASTPTVQPVQPITIAKDNIIPPEYMEDMIRDYMEKHDMLDVADKWNNEKPHKTMSLCDRQKFDEALGLPKLQEDKQFHTRLENFLVMWNKAEHNSVIKTTNLAKSKKKQGQKSSSKQKIAKPIPAAIAINTQDESVLVATPTNIGVPDTITNLQSSGVLVGRPGSTPKPRLNELKAFGFDDVVDDIAVTTCHTLDTEPQTNLETYTSSKSNQVPKKRVRIGDPGLTPKKEYIFYRETPPLFVTETEEEAREVMEKLSHDPNYDVQEIKDRYVELSSSDVGKYSVGQRVENLGAKRDITGIVSKKYGSKQCGQSGPGTIVIDTEPTDELQKKGIHNEHTIVGNYSTTLTEDDEEYLSELVSVN